ncbi:MAG TPA: hypothetical protein VKV39_05880 [Candidatus Sulfotelmatobacter sp.]|nr:hypothetical protein [Candidatus Sulfotelmatobacter sp.]
MIALLLLSDDDGMKVLFVLIVAGVFMLLARWASRSASTSGALTPMSDTRLALLPDANAEKAPGQSSLTRGPGAEEVAASFPADPQLRKLRIRKFYFAKTEARPGPADPEVFADELFVELYDPDTGWDWWQSYYVVTPKGLANVLNEKHWKYLHAPQMLAVPRYDLEEIRRAVVSRVVADHEHFKGLAESEQVKEETL